MIEPLFAGAVAVVTGAASGIGRAVTLALVEAGCLVAAMDRDEAGVRACASGRARGVPGTVEPHVVDVSDERAVGSAVRNVEAEMGPIDFLVNGAGVLSVGSLLDGATDGAALRCVTAVNLEGVFHVTRAVAQRMVERRRGAIVTVSSNAASTPRVSMGVYCASKAAASMLTRCFGLELAEYGIRCNVVSPGSTDTPMLRRMLGEKAPWTLVEGDPRAFRAGIPLGRIAEPSDVAAAVLFLLSPAARHITLNELCVDGGATW